MRPEAKTDLRVIEAMLLRWGENHASGRTVTFQLPENDGPHPFKGLKCGPTNGQRLALSIALINDDETVTASDAYETSNAQLAGILCNDANFQAFLRATDWVGVNSPELAATRLRALCGVNSRKELDTSQGGAQQFHDLRVQFEEWKRWRDA